jgi:ATP-binding cassette subfamily B (MDR/TAP) protein 1
MQDYVFWAEAVVTTTYLINTCPSTSLGMKTLEEVWSKYPYNLDRLRVFGCVAYAHISQDKVKHRALRCMFLGYPERVKAYSCGAYIQVIGGVSQVEM